MKAMRIKMNHPDGSSVFWTSWREERVFNVGGNLDRPYTGPMWMLRRHDGTECGLEANWANSVPLIRASAEAYGYETAVS